MPNERFIMTYPAPRHGLFAVFILVSLTLNLLFFVISAERQQKERYERSIQAEAVAIAEELSAPLSINDRISMSVVANRYIRGDDVAFVGVYDVNDNLLVPVGKETNGHAVKEVVTGSQSVLGYVTVQTHEINRAKIISDNWMYLVGVSFLHALLLLIYGYVARPTDAICTEISHDVRNRLLAKGLLYDVNQKNHAHSSGDPIGTQTGSSSTHHAKHDTPPTQSEPSHQAQSEHTYVIQARFDDPKDLLATVSNQTKNVYFSLCHQLLSKATTELLALPVFHGVSVESISPFDDQGCRIVLSGKDKYSKSALASILLARLALMLNQTIYDKHRELKRFALPIRTYVSDVARQDEVVSVGIKHRKTPLVLMPNRVITDLSSHGNFLKLADPISVAERECRHLRHVSVSHAETLERVRDKVLLSG
ncbi:Uncharacterised protein [Moraxella bovis]|uniref:Uncharacterized protein n=2 Tax=Moraxella bovis TaxID=476 RepID=A0A378PQN0_MORBO|nr:Uncharacterised protein [Moraxella bovis]